MSDSAQLLTEYIQHGSETAFRELVTRYINLVFSAALRLVGGDTQLAQDVTQTVFIDLARKARDLSSGVMLGSWLYQRTFHVATTFIRGERRRQNRERKAVEMNSLQDHTPNNLAQIAPFLDEAILQLATEDRTAILLRFFEQRNFRSVGQALGSTEDAARMRVSRALEKLEVLLKHRGVSLSAAALGTLLGAEAITAAPAGLAVTVSVAALAGTAAGTGSGLTLTKLLTMIKLKTTIIGALVVTGVAAPLEVQHHKLATLRGENNSLKQQAELAASLAAENEQLSNRLAETSTSANDTQIRELLRLRAEVAMLRRQTNELGKLEADNLRLKTALAKAPPPAPDAEETDPAREQMKATGIAKMNDAKYLVLGCILFAQEHQDQFPANLDQAKPYVDTKNITQTNQFELMYQGSIRDLAQPASTIVLREKEAWMGLNGKWAKGYAFADGHAEVHVAQDGNFEPWERQRLVAFQTPNQPGH